VSDKGAYGVDKFIEKRHLERQHFRWRAEPFPSLQRDDDTKGEDDAR
jgi:hypothetical protein